MSRGMVHATSSTCRPRGNGPKTNPPLLLGSQARQAHVLFFFVSFFFLFCVGGWERIDHRFWFCQFLFRWRNYSFAPSLARSPTLSYSSTSVSPLLYIAFIPIYLTGIRVLGPTAIPNLRGCSTSSIDIHPTTPVSCARIRKHVHLQRITVCLHMFTVMLILYMEHSGTCQPLAINCGNDGKELL